MKLAKVPFIENNCNNPNSSPISTPSSLPRMLQATRPVNAPIC